LYDDESENKRLSSLRNNFFVPPTRDLFVFHNLTCRSDVTVNAEIPVGGTWNFGFHVSILFDQVTNAGQKGAKKPTSVLRSLAFTPDRQHFFHIVAYESLYVKHSAMYAYGYNDKEDPVRKKPIAKTSH